MKTKLALFLACVGILMSSHAFACGTSCDSYNYTQCYSNGCDTCGSYDSCGYYTGCSYSTDCNTCNTPPSDCDCADFGYRYNDCISKCEYCDAFGNIGVR